MELTCPVCGETGTDPEAHCPKCGFPRKLAARLPEPVTFIPPAEPDALAETKPVRRAGRSVAEPGPETELNAAIARTLQDRMTLLRSVDPEAPDVTGELCEAALNEASGRAGDAQQILRSAQSRLDRETEELLARHLTDLEDRGRALEAGGLRLALEDQLAHLAETFLAGDPAASIAGLSAAERHLRRIEELWRALQELLGQVTMLQEEAARLGLPLDGEPDRLAALRDGLRTMPATEHDLDVAAQAASEVLMRLHATLPPSLELELAHHGAAIDAHPIELPRARSARRLHSEAVQQMANGRLVDAVASVRELRTVLKELAEEAAAAKPEVVEPATPTAEAAVEAAPEAPEVGAPPPRRRMPLPVHGRERVVAEPAAAPGPPKAPEPADTDEGELAALMQQARDLAARVRALPAGSPEAKVAARQLQEATRHLKARRYREAHGILNAPSPEAPEGPEAGVSVPSDRPLRPAAPPVLPPIGPTDSPELAALTQKARNLAAWVRTLPPDSDEARTASRDIQEATVLLEAHRLAEADAALTRIMGVLAVHSPRR